MNDLVRITVYEGLTIQNTLNKRGLKTSDVSRELGITNQLMTRYLLGQEEMPRKYLRAIHQNLDWDPGLKVLVEKSYGPVPKSGILRKK